MHEHKIKIKKFLAPRYWPIWLVVGLLWLLSRLPYRTQIKMGTLLGRLIARFGGKSRRIAETNLQLCFPEMTNQQRAELLQKNFESIGVSIFEIGLACFGSEKKLQPLIHIHGLEHLKAALEKGKGVLYIGTHFTTLQLIGRLMSMQVPFSVVYRHQKNRLLNEFTLKIVKRFYARSAARGDLRGILDCLKQNLPIWFTPDVDAGLRNSVFVPFFGVTAASITATARLAKLSGAPVMTGGYYRRDDMTGYDMVINPPLENFPSDDIVQDTLRINQAQEAAIRVKPEQYLWQYKRFKTRPPGEPRLYV